jgi:GNAT superfamily N-acetyltransferase
MMASNKQDHQALINAVEENLWEMWSHFGRGPGCGLHDEGDCLWFENPIPIIPYNGILKFQVEEDVDNRIEKLIKHFRERQADFMWVVHPTSKPANLPELLRAHGLQEIEPMPCMVRHLDKLPDPPPIPDGMELREVLEEDDESEFVDFASWRWGVEEKFKHQLSDTFSEFRVGKPGTKTHVWQIWHGTNPVAKAGVYFSKSSAGIYAVATKPEAQRLGLASIVTITALQFARNYGKDLAILYSTPMAERLYRRLGFIKIADAYLYGSVVANV